MSSDVRAIQPQYSFFVRLLVRAMLGWWGFITMLAILTFDSYQLPWLSTSWQALFQVHAWLILGSCLTIFGLNILAFSITHLTHLIRISSLAGSGQLPAGFAVAIGARVLAKTTRPVATLWLVRTASTFLGIIVLASGLISLHPSWCPGAVCHLSLTSSPVPPGTAQDAHLQMSWTAFQSDSYVIPGDPMQYHLDNLPQSIGAQRIDQPAPTHPYSIIFSLHSLDSSQIQIHSISLEVVSIPPQPQTLRVWHPSSLNYMTNLYSVTYNRQISGNILEATPLDPNTHIYLASGESTTVTLRIASQVAVDLQYRIQVTYLTKDRLLPQLLQISQIFEVNFGSIGNWNEFAFQDGRFVPLNKQP